MSKQELILHKICSYYIPDDWYYILPSKPVVYMGLSSHQPNPSVYMDLSSHQLLASDSVPQETIDKIFKTFKLYSFKIGGY